MKELDQGYEFTKAQLAELEQLRQRVKELEASAAFWLAERNGLQVKDDAVIASLSADLEVAEKRVAELTRVNYSHRAEEHAVKGMYEMAATERQDALEQLAASQLDNLRLRSALEKMNAAFVEVPVTIHTSVAIDSSYEALSTTTDTEALEKYLADRLGEPVGYWFSDDPQVCAYPGSGYFPGSIPPNDAVNITPLYSLKEKGN